MGRNRERNGERERKEKKRLIYFSKITRAGLTMDQGREKDGRQKINSLNEQKKTLKRGGITQPPGQPCAPEDEVWSPGTQSRSRLEHQAWVLHSGPPQRRLMGQDTTDQHSGGGACALRVRLGGGACALHVPPQGAGSDL